jgi:hypothetical protein
MDEINPQAAELRIGNWVMGNKPFQIDMNTLNMSYIHELANNAQGRFEPIPLTEDWLVKFGFEKLQNNLYSKGRLTYHKTYGWKILENWVKKWSGVQELKYVHQLQNLYHALTGQELVVCG